MAAKEKTRTIYRIGAVSGLVDNSRGTEDDLHLWVRQWVPDNEHISDLTDEQADFIIERLREYSRGLKSMKQSERMSEEQKNKAFSLTYRLAQLSPSNVPVRERLAGVVTQVTGRKANLRGGIFAGCSSEDGRNIIETLKRYVNTEERKKKRGDNNGDVRSGGAAPP